MVGMINCKEILYDWTVKSEEEYIVVKTLVILKIGEWSIFATDHSRGL